MVLLLRPADIRGLLPMAEAIEAVEEGFREWGLEPGLNAPRRRIHMPSGVRVSVHQGGVPGLGFGGLLTHCEWVRPQATHQEFGLRNHPVAVLYEAAEGRLTALIVGEPTASELPDVGESQALRTAATSIVGLKRLARPDAAVVGVFGAGMQAKAHLVGLATARRLREVRAYRRDAAACRRFAAEMSALLHTDVRPVARPEDAVRGVDVVLAATNASQPVFDGAWLEPGQHVTSIVGSNIGLVRGGFTREPRREIDDTTLRRSDLIVVANRQQVVQDEQGDLYDPIQRGIIALDDLVELSDLVAGKVPGPVSATQITLYKNNAGQGLADVALAARLLQRARERGLGVELGFE
jgi:alanine dehydrogenase